MRKTFIILSIVASVTGIIFLFLPMGSIAFLPATFSIIAAVVALLKSKKQSKALPKVLLLCATTIFFIVMAKDVLVNNKLTAEKELIKEKQETQTEVNKELQKPDGIERRQ